MRHHHGFTAYDMCLYFINQDHMVRKDALSQFEKRRIREYYFTTVIRYLIDLL